MKGTSIKVGLALVLFVLAGLGFWSNHDEGTLDQGVPRAVRQIAAAVSAGDAKRVAAILEDRPDLVDSSVLEEPMLLRAARLNKPEVIACLLQHGADRNARGDGNATALHWACWWGSTQAAEELVAQGFPIEDRSDAYASTPLLWAAHGSNRPDSPGVSGDYEGTVRMLIAHGASADTCNGQGVSALSMASNKVAKVLMESGATRQGHPSTRPSRSGVTA